MIILLSCIFIPLILILIGRVLLDLKTEPNWIFGYRTAMSMKNQDTWEYGQQLSGKTFFKLGIIECAIGIILYILFQNTIENYIPLIDIFQLITIMAVILYTEIQLRRVFDQKGNKKTD